MLTYHAIESVSAAMQQQQRFAPSWHGIQAPCQLLVLAAGWLGSPDAPSMLTLGSSIDA